MDKTDDQLAEKLANDHPNPDFTDDYMKSEIRYRLARDLALSTSMGIWLAIKAGLVKPTAKP